MATHQGTELPTARWHLLPLSGGPMASGTEDGKSRAAANLAQASAIHLTNLSMLG
jgi:hypothetical protein